MSDLFRDKIAKLKDRISELEAESEKRLAQSQARESHYLLRIEELEGLLSVARCPDAGCDNKGTVCRGEYQHENGEVEADIVQCQWCDEKASALKGVESNE